MPIVGAGHAGGRRGAVEAGRRVRLTHESQDGMLAYHEGVVHDGLGVVGQLLECQDGDRTHSLSSEPLQGLVNREVAGAVLDPLHLGRQVGVPEPVTGGREAAVVAQLR